MLSLEVFFTESKSKYEYIFVQVLMMLDGLMLDLE